VPGPLGDFAQIDACPLWMPLLQSDAGERHPGELADLVEALSGPDGLLEPCDGGPMKAPAHLDQPHQEAGAAVVVARAPHLAEEPSGQAIVAALERLVTGEVIERAGQRTGEADTTRRQSIRRKRRGMGKLWPQRDDLLERRGEGGYLGAGDGRLGEDIKGALLKACLQEAMSQGETAGNTESRRRSPRGQKPRAADKADDPRVDPLVTKLRRVCGGEIVDGP